VGAAVRQLGGRQLTPMLAARATFPRRALGADSAARQPDQALAGCLHEPAPADQAIDDRPWLGCSTVWAHRRTWERRHLGTQERLADGLVRYAIMSVDGF